MILHGRRYWRLVPRLIHSHVRIVAGMTTQHMLLTAGILTLTACVAALVQEMSNARQAIYCGRSRRRGSAFAGNPERCTTFVAGRRREAGLAPTTMPVVMRWMRGKRRSGRGQSCKIRRSIRRHPHENVLFALLRQWAGSRASAFAMQLPKKLRRSG